MSPAVARAEAMNLERARASLETWALASATPEEMRKVQEEIARQTQGVLDGLVLRFARKGGAENPRKKGEVAPKREGVPAVAGCGP
jgi:hypothetical protein